MTPQKKVTKRKTVKKKMTWMAYGILNAYGDPWTKKTFETVGDAERYMEVFWGAVANRPDMSKHRVIEVRISAH